MNTLEQPIALIIILKDIVVIQANEQSGCLQNCCGCMATDEIQLARIACLLCSSAASSCTFCNNLSLKLQESLSSEESGMCHNGVQGEQITP